MSVTVPVLTTAGAHTIYAVGDQGSQASKAITINAERHRRPGGERRARREDTGGSTGYVKNTGTFYVYANVTDVGSPAVGVSTVTRGRVHDPDRLDGGRHDHGGRSMDRRRRRPTTTGAPRPRRTSRAEGDQGVHDQGDRREREQHDAGRLQRRHGQHRAHGLRHPDGERRRHRRQGRDRRHRDVHLQRADGPEPDPRVVDGSLDHGHRAPHERRRWQRHADDLEQREHHAAAARVGEPGPYRLRRRRDADLHRLVDGDERLDDHDHARHAERRRGTTAAGPARWCGRPRRRPGTGPRTR